MKELTRRQRWATNGVVWGFHAVFWVAAILGAVLYLTTDADTWRGLRSIYLGVALGGVAGLILTASSRWGRRRR